MAGESRALPNPALYRARWVLPVAGGPIEDGAVMVRGLSIDAVGRYKDLRKGWPANAVVDLGEAAVLPGLINCHTHLDNSALAGRTPRGGGDMLAWIEAQGAAWAEIPDEERRKARNDAWQSLPSSGTVAVADITSSPFDTDMLGGEPLWGSIFQEVRGFGRDRAEASFERALTLATEGTKSVSGVWLRFAVSPHGPHSVHADVLTRIAEHCFHRGDVLTMHVAESPEEVALMRGSDDRFVEALGRWGFWEESFTPPRCSPVEYLHRLGLLRPELMAVHCVQLDDDDISLLAGSGASVCFCPRSNDYIGVGLPRIGDILAAGIRCCLGTDGPASVETLSLFDEMAFIANRFPSVPPGAILRMATLGGAEALRLDSLAGSLEMNKLARFLVYSGDLGNDPEAALTGGIDMDKLAWAGGTIDLRK